MRRRWRLLPAAVRARSAKQLVLHRSSRQLLLLEQGQLRLRVPAAVGTQGWKHLLASIGCCSKRWIPYGGIPALVLWSPLEAEILWARDGLPFIRTVQSWWLGWREGGAGSRLLHVGLHGTPHRWTVRRAVSHGCVRLYDEHIRRIC